MQYDTLKKNADRVCAAAVAQGVPGVAAMVATPSTIIYEGAAGRRDDACNIMSTDTVLDIASMTKPIAGLAAMQLVERGTLTLDAPAADYVPEIGALKVLTGWDGDRPILRNPNQPITLRHLLTHTAGMGYEVWDRDTARYNAIHAIPGIESGDPRALEGALVNDPGEKWLYGTAIDWVSRIVERITGQSFGSYLDDNVLGPLAMRDTGFRISDRMQPRLAKNYLRGDDDRFSQTERIRPQAPPIETGGAGLYSTAADYIRFAQLFLNDGTLEGSRIIHSQTARLMGQNAMGTLRVAGLTSSRPTWARDLIFFPTVAQTWGLSFHINEAAIPSRRAAGSLSWAGIFNTYFWIDPTSRLCAVFMTQTTPFLDPMVVEAFDAFERGVYASFR